VRIATLNMLNAPATLTERNQVLDKELARLNPVLLAAQEVLRDPDDPDAVHPEIVESMGKAGLVHAVLGRPGEGHAPGEPGGSPLVIRHSVAVFYREDSLKLVDSGVFDFGISSFTRFQPPGAAWAVFRRLDAPDSPAVVLFSAHFAWGGDAGYERLESARRVEAHASHLARIYPGSKIFLGGDLNETPDSDTLRYLRGLTAVVPGAYWIDTWEWLNEGEPGHTQIPTSEYAIATALVVGIKNPSLMPKRRLDYLMVRGWEYGGLGEAPTVETWGVSGGRYASDHLGLVLSVEF
jgi:endonuclease/exonuclease/phosphatase family metal-dependent hydrolase